MRFRNVWKAAPGVDVYGECAGSRVEHANVAGSYVLRQDVPKRERTESRIFVSVESGSNCGKTTSASQGDVHFGEVGLSSSYKYLEDPLTGWDLDVIRRGGKRDAV